MFGNDCPLHSVALMEKKTASDVSRVFTSFFLANVVLLDSSLIMNDVLCAVLCLIMNCVLCSVLCASHE